MKRKHSGASEIMLTILNQIKFLSCDRSGAATKIRHVDRVFKDLYGVKRYGTRVAACKNRRQLVPIFQEIGVRELWSLLGDQTYFEVVTLLVDVLERRSALKGTIQKAQKKLNGDLRMDQKSKWNKRITEATAELRWINKKYEKSIESLQESLNIHPKDSDDYKERFRGLKNFVDHGSIGGNRYYEDDYEMYRGSGFRFKSHQPFQLDGEDDDYDYDYDPYGDRDYDLSSDPRDEQIQKLREEIDRLKANPYGYAPQPQPAINPQYSQYPQPQQTPDMNELMRIIGNLAKRVDGLTQYVAPQPYDDADDEDDDTPHPGFTVEPGYKSSVTEEDFRRMYYGEDPSGYAPYVENDLKITGVPSTEELMRRQREATKARELEMSQNPQPQREPDWGDPTQPVRTSNPVPPTPQVVVHSTDSIDARNREEVREKATDYMKQQGDISPTPAPPTPTPTPNPVARPTQ